MTKYCIVVLLILSLALTAQISAQCTAGQESLQKGIDSLAHNDFALAEHCFVDSYNSAVKEGNGEVMTLSLSMLGDLHAFFSSYTVARRFYLKAQDCAKDDRKLQASLSFSLGALEWMAGNYKDSLGYFEKVDKEAGDTVPPLMKVRALTFEGSSFTTLKEYSRAESCLTRALRILEKQDSPYLTSFCNMLLGDVYRERSETQRALTCYQSALGEARKHLADDHYLYSQIYYHMGVFFERLAGSEPDVDASSCYQKSFDAMMCVDGHLTFREKLQVPHTDVESGKKLTAILLEEGKEEEALQMCQRSKEWEYIEDNRSMLPCRILAEGSPKLAHALQIQEISEQKAAEARITEKGAAREELSKALQENSDEYGKTAAELLETSPYIGSLLLPVNITMQDLIYSLSQDDGFVEFCAVDSHIYGWYADLTEFKVWEVPQKTADVLMTSAKRGEEPDSAKDYTAYRTLAQKDVFGPAASLITGKKRVIISPDMPFFTFPFAGLRDDAGAPLAKSRQVQLCLSSPLWTLRTMKRYTTRKSFLLCTLGEKGLGNCRQIDDSELLNYSRSQIMPDESASPSITFSGSSLADREALQFYPLFSPRVAIQDSEAIEIRVDEALKDAAVIHFSTYGSFHREIPFLSGPGIYNSILSARHLYTVKLPPAHVALSLYAGCGQDRGNRGLYSVGRALIFAGARSVMVNTRIPDKDIHLSLLTEYYQAVKSGLSEGEAFMMAQQKSMEKFPGSDYWASMLFMGRRYDDN
ncbi:MAG: CHAT domain-containing protein [Candidatus Xenobiia bacterium LiM19]